MQRRAAGWLHLQHLLRRWSVAAGQLWRLASCELYGSHNHGRALLASSNGVAPGKIDRALREHQAGNEASFAKLLGESVAMHLAGMLGQLLPQMPWQPECFFCVSAARAAVRAYQVAVANAQQAGEDVPEAPAPPGVAKGLTYVPVTQLVQTPAGQVPGTSSVPACWDHVQVQGDAPRATGLVAPDGRPIVHSGG